MIKIDSLEKENKELKEDNITLKQQFEEDIEKICSSIISKYKK